MIRNIIVTLALIISANSFAQSDTQSSKAGCDWNGLAQSITKGKTSKHDKAYAIYRWLCDNIAYDTSYTIYDAETAYEQKRGVCQAYCEMFVRIGGAAGLSVDMIRGKARDFRGTVLNGGHAWVYVRTDGNGGMMIDPTWGAGYVNDGVFTRYKEKNDSWFNVEPEWMIFSHYPNNESNQFLTPKIDYNTFTSLPALYPWLKTYGFKGSELLAASLAGKKLDIPKCYETNNIRIGKIPNTGTLRIGTAYDFIIEPLGDYEFAIFNGDEFEKGWRRNNKYQQIRFVPGNSGELSVSYHRRGSDEGWPTLITYKVAAPNFMDIANLEKTAPQKSPALKNLQNYDATRFRKHGINSAKLLAAVKKENIKQVPKIYDAGEFILNNVPFNGNLKVGRSYKFEFTPREAGDWVIINNGQFLKEWRKNAQSRVWSTTIVPAAPGKIVLAFKRAGNSGTQYSYCVEYVAEK